MSQALESQGSGVPGTWRRVPAVLPAEVPKYPIPPTPTPKRPLSFQCIKEFQCTLGINLSLSRPRAGFGRTQFHHKGTLPLCRHPPTTLFCPFLALPKGLNRKWAKAGVGTSRPLLPRETARLQEGDSKAGCWATSLLPRQREGLTHRNESRAVPVHGTRGRDPAALRGWLRAACALCIPNGFSLHIGPLEPPLLLVKWGTCPHPSVGHPHPLARESLSRIPTLSSHLFS